MRSAGGSFALDAKVTDVRQPLAYTSRKLYRQWLIWLGLPALVASIVLVAIQPDDFTPVEWIVTWSGVVLGGAMTLLCVYRLFVPGKPMLLLLPTGLRLHFEFLKDIVIPWSAVQGVDTIDIATEFRGTPVRLSGVTVVLVSQRFYDVHIHERSLLLRGPSWHNWFIPKGDQVQVALHHDTLPATAQELRAAVEARWRAFRDQQAQPSPPTKPPAAS
jgi:hypothetical protein